MNLKKALNRLAWGLSLGAAAYFGSMSLHISRLSRYDHGQPMNFAVAAVFAVAAFAAVWTAYVVLHLTIIKPSLWLVHACRGIRDVRVTCPQCGRRLWGATTKMLGQIGICPKCRTEFPITEQQSPSSVEFTPVEDLLRHAKGLKQLTLEKRRKQAKPDRAVPPSNVQSEINNQRSDAPPAAPIETTTAADMMALCDSIVASTARLLEDKSCRQEMDPEELLAFAMAVVTEIYTLGQGSAAKATPALDGFHDVMGSLMERRLLQEGNPNINDATVNQLLDHFFELLRMRYPEYQRAFRNDVWRKNPTWFSLSGLVLQRVFDNRLTDEQKATLLVPLALHIAMTIIHSMDVLFPPKTKGQEETLPADFTPIERLLKFDGESDMPAWTHGEAAGRALFPESRRRRTAEPPAPPINPQSAIKSPPSDAPPPAPKQ